MKKLGAHAIVIGAGIGGLVAARVLADRYDRVTILERDALPAKAEPRKGVPHGRHAHGLLARGREVLEEMFPALTEDLIDAGAVPGDTLGDGRWYNFGVYLASGHSGMRSILLSRPLLETHVATEAARRPSRFDPGADVGPGARSGYGQPSNRRGTPRGRCGRQGRDHASRSRRRRLGPSLALRRVARKPGLSPAGRGDLGVRISYASRFLRHRPDHLAGKRVALIAAHEPVWRFGVALAVEHDRWIVTQGGYFDDMPQSGNAASVGFAENPCRTRHRRIAGGSRATPAPVGFGFPASRRSRYERLARFPEGYLVFGDALCSFNPIYGQGMTAAALEAAALRDCLTREPVPCSTLLCRGLEDHRHALADRRRQ